MKNILADIDNRIDMAKKRSGREQDEVLMVAVSKTQPLEKILEAQKCGINVFGENKVQELIEKYPLTTGIKWHFIGHLQKNKVKYIIDKVDLIHSVDSLELAQEINKRAAAVGIEMAILIQINIGKEPTKSGIYEEEVLAFMNSISECDNLKIKGIMTVPPINVDEAVTRKHFARMKEIFCELQKLDYNNFDIKYLSMGMTDDFELAIEEGANIVRIGSGIFGKRVYKEV